MNHEGNGDLKEDPWNKRFLSCLAHHMFNNTKYILASSLNFRHTERQKYG